MLACVSLTRGDEKEVWFAAEPLAADLDLSVKGIPYCVQAGC
ncbi:MAG: hypothetical protein R2741_03020 [Methanolobus sp.]